MSFSHAYSLVNATANDVTIRNPHGDTEQEQGLFSEEVKNDVTALVAAIDSLEKEFLKDEQIKDDSKKKMDKAFENIGKNILIKNRFNREAKDWNKIVKKMILEAAIWKPEKDKKGFIKKLANNITELKQHIGQKAEHSDKNNGNKLKDGFLSRTIKLSAEQTISYKVLKDYFERVSISIIR